MSSRHLLPGLALALAACTAAPAPALVPTAALLSLPAATATRPPTPAASPAPAATPVIIASPTATATPVTHVVAAGETMLGIAIQYGVSLDALQAANPNVEPRFLSISTVLVIPPPEGALAIAATNLAPPPPASVTLSQPACYALPTGGLYCLAEARNTNEKPIENVSARIILAGADGLPFASQTAVGALDLIPPGGVIPLAALFQSSTAQSAAAIGVELQTANLVADNAPGTEPVMLEVTAKPGALVGGRWTVAGRVHNASPMPLASAWVLLTVYDTAGRVVGFRKLSLDGHLAAGEARDFVISSTSLDGPIRSGVVMAEGRP